MNMQRSEDKAKQIDKGIKEGIRIAIEEHKRNGHTIVVMKNGEVVKIKPEKQRYA